MKPPEITLESIQAARTRITGRVRHTPVLESEILNTLAGAELHFKCENLQVGGAFKARGAVNAVFSIPDDELRAGVVTHSSGNHGAALARAARLRGVRARIVMPENSLAAKFDAVRSYGGEIVRCAPTLEAREAAAAQIVLETGAVFIHPYDDPRVIAGQGTISLELLEELPELQCLLVPVGGGGLASGVATAAKAIKPAIRVVGVEPTGADDAQRSFQSGTLTAVTQPKTIADGLRATISPRTLAIIRAQIDDVVTVGDEAIVRAMRMLWQHLKVIVEPSSAVAYAAVLEGIVDVRGLRVGIVLTGGNVDLDALPWLAR
jgi:threonine dehydratase